MAEACVFIPSRGKNLFAKLRQNFDYGVARDIFLRSINPEFINDNKKQLSLDSEGVPTFDSLMQNKWMKAHIGEKQLSSMYEKDFHKLDDTRDNYYHQLEAANNFNTTSPGRKDFVAVVKNEDDKIVVSVVPKTDNNVKIASEQYSTHKLNDKLASIFSPIGITIGDLEDYEVQAGRTGVTDFNKAKEAANGLESMVRVANNMEGAEAVTEEFSHLIIGVRRDDPLVYRTINVLSNDDEALRDVLGKDYDDVREYYNGDTSLMAEEAAGHILMNRLKHGENITYAHAHRSLFKRMADFIVNLFKRFTPGQASSAINEAELYMSRLAKNIVNGSITILREDVAKSQRNASFNALSDRIKRNIKILNMAAIAETKKGKIFKAKPIVVIQKVTDILKYADETQDTVLGLLNYADEALEELRTANETLDKIDTFDARVKFKVLRDMRQTVLSFKPFIDSLLDALTEENEEKDNMFRKVYTSNGQDIDLGSILGELNNKYGALERRVAKISVPMFIEFLKPYWGNDIIIPFGKNKGKKITLEDLVAQADKDISFFDRWLDAMGDSSDLLLQMFDAVVKDSRDNARLKFIDDTRKIIALRQKAESYGITDFKWIFERDNEGHKTGNYISEMNYGQYNKDKKELYDRLEKKYGKNPTGQNAFNKEQEIEDWHKTHSITVGSRYFPNKAIYHNKAFDALSAHQKEIYDEFMAIKRSYDQKFPDEKVGAYKAIQQRKGTTQRILDAFGDTQSLINNIKEATIGQLVEREDDDAIFGDKVARRGITGFDGEEIFQLPVIYTTKLKDPDEISDDVFASLMSYGYAADNYEEMEKIIDPLEVGRTIVKKERQVLENRGGKKVIERIENAGIISTKKLTVSRSNIEARLDDFFESQIYGRYLKDGGTFDVLGQKLNRNKIVSWLLHSSSLAQLGFNFLANTANLITGAAMLNIESVANQFFSIRQLAEADKEYAAALGAYLPEVGNRYKESKLALFDDLFNVRQNFGDNVNRAQLKNMFRRIFGENIAFIGQDSGDHWLYNRTAIAMALAEEVYVDGKKTNLWEALKVKKDQNGLSYIDYKNIKDKNGKPFNVKTFGRRVASANQSMFGIYNQEDQNAASRVAMGRLLQQYRRWMKAQFNKRFESRQYKYATQSWEEGYYVTVVRILGELKRGEVQLPEVWSSLTDVEKQNVKRAVFEFAQFLAVWGLANLIDWPDDKNRPWAVKYAEYASKRASHELGGLTPSPTFSKENLKTVKTPLPVISVVQNSVELLSSVMDPTDWVDFDATQSGPYKGMSTLEKNFIKAPIPGVAQYRQISKFTGDIDNSIQYYMRPSF